MKRVLVAYFSASGQTARLAKTLAAVVGGELHEIRPQVPYDKADLDWRDPNSRSSLEMKRPSARPPLADTVVDMGRYDTVFVGFPIWWYEAPAHCADVPGAVRLFRKDGDPVCNLG